MISRATLVNARQTLVQAHLRQQGCRHPENPKILQILIQTVRAPQITAHPPNPKNHSSDKRSQSLMISRATLVNARQTLVQAHLRQQGCRHPENPKILQILIQTVRAPQITAHPPNPKNHSSDKRSQSSHDLSCNARERSSNARTSAPAPARTPLSENPKILQILTQTVRAPQITAHPPNPKNHSSDKRSQSFMISRETLVNARKHSYKRTSASKEAAILKIHKILQILLQTIHPSLVNTRKTLVNSRASLAQALTSCLRPIRQLSANVTPTTAPQSPHFGMYDSFKALSPDQRL